MHGFKKLASEINVFLKTQTGKDAMSIEEIAMGFVRVANEAMCRPIRALTQAKGYGYLYYHVCINQ